MKCAVCGLGELIPQTRNEDFEHYLDGNTKISVHAENVPVEKCSNCGGIASGPQAAKVRQSAVEAALKNR